jgi:mannosyltransferase OCH1-like enzyme
MSLPFTLQNDIEPSQNAATRVHMDKKSWLLFLCAMCTASTIYYGNASYSRFAQLGELSPSLLTTSFIPSSSSSSTTSSSAQSTKPTPTVYTDEERLRVLTELTQRASSEQECPNYNPNVTLIRITNHVNHEPWPSSSLSSSSLSASLSSQQQLQPQPQRRIPLIIHQTSKFQCVTPSIYKVVHQWQNLTGFSYFFHDDAAMQRLLERHYTTFPNLQQVVEHCTVSKTTLSDIWRYILLWEFGGIYVDLDSAPRSFNASSIHAEDDAYFVLEVFHILSQYFMASAPRHPILWYAINIALDNMLHVADTGKVMVAFMTGPHAVHEAFTRFLQDGGYNTTTIDPDKPVKGGFYVGTNNWTLHADGSGDDADAIVVRDAMGPMKKEEYTYMGMTHYHVTRDIATGVSCRTAIRESVLSQVYQQQDGRRNSTITTVL